MLLLVGLWFKKYNLMQYYMEQFSIKQIKQLTSYEKEKMYGLDVGTKHNNNYASCYAIPISTPKPITKKVHTDKQSK